MSEQRTSKKRLSAAQERMRDMVWKMGTCTFRGRKRWPTINALRKLKLVQVYSEVENGEWLHTVSANYPPEPMLSAWATAMGMQRYAGSAAELEDRRERRALGMVE